MAGEEQADAVAGESLAGELAGGLLGIAQRCLLHLIVKAAECALVVK
ncbi:hypothetical protein ACFVXG_15350 [Kitasatospora sp. NPDC058162]